jgi:PST family polysaccharide transporter
MNAFNKEEIKSKAVSATKWSFFARYIPVLTSLISQIFLARLLAPSDYGIVGICSSIIGFSVIFQGGRGVAFAIIQKKEDDIQNYSSALAMNLSFGITIYVLMILASPAIAAYAKDVRIIHVVPVQGLSVLLSSVSSIFIAKLQRDFGFKKIAYLTFAYSLAPLMIGIPLAYLGFRYWSLIIMSLVGDIVSLILLQRMTVLKFKLTFDAARIKSLFAFSKWTVLEDIMSWLINNADIFLIARFFSIQQVGIYVFAKKIISIGLGSIMQPLNPIMYSSFCRMNSSPEDLKRVFIQLSKIVALVMFPVIAAIAITAPELVPIVFGKKWIDAGLIVSLFGISEISYLITPCSLLTQAKGKPSINAKLMVVNSLFLLAGYFVAAHISFPCFAFIRITGAIFMPIWVVIVGRLLSLEKPYFYYIIRVPLFSTLVLSVVLYFTIILIKNTISVSLLRLTAISFLLIIEAAIYMFSIFVFDKGSFQHVCNLFKEAIGNKLLFMIRPRGKDNECLQARS